MSAMFAGAASFNSDLSEWDVSSMTSMFHSATSLGLGLVVLIHMNYYVSKLSNVNPIFVTMIEKN